MRDDHRRVRPRPGHRLQRQRPGHLGHRPDGPYLDLRLHQRQPAHLGHRPDDATSPATPTAPGSTGNPLLANDLLTITGPNAQPGGPDAGDSTVNVYDSLGRVTSQTDPMGFQTTFNYCVNAAAGDCMNPATGTGFVTVTDPDGNTTVDDYTDGTLAAETQTTGRHRHQRARLHPRTTAGSTSGGTLLDAADHRRQRQHHHLHLQRQRGRTTSSHRAGLGRHPPRPPSATPRRTRRNCDGTADAASLHHLLAGRRPAPVAPGGVITPPSSAPPLGVTYTLYDTDGNELYYTTGVYQPGGSSAVVLRGPPTSCSRATASP